MTTFAGGMTPTAFYAGLNYNPKVFNVKEYGALGNAIQDDTTYIQAAINACETAGGGIVFFPNGVYIIGGALQTNVNTINYNSQLYIPSKNFSDLTRCCIHLLGESPPNMTQSNYIGNAIAPNTGVVLRSTITSITPESYVIGSKGLAANYGSVNYNQCNVDNIQFQLNADGSTNKLSVGGIGFKYGGNSIIKNVTVFPYDTNVVGIADPTVYCTGIALPMFNSEAFNSVAICNVGGFTSGYYLGDHFMADFLGAARCVNAFEIGHFNHLGVGSRFHFGGCTKGLTFTEGESRIFITDLHAEWIYDTDPALCRMINDASNYARGIVSYDIAYGNVLRNDLFSKVGGTMIRCYPSDFTSAVNFTISGARDETEGALKDFITKICAILGITDSTTAS